MQFRWENLLWKKQRRDTKQSKIYYKNDKERLKKQTKNKCRNLIWRRKK